MIYEFMRGKAANKDIRELVIDAQKQYFGFVNYDESEPVLRKFNLSQAPLTDYLTGRFMVFETHDGFDFICLNMLNFKEIFSKKYRVYIYVQKNLLLFIYNAAFIEKVFRDIVAKYNSELSFERILLAFFEKLVFDNENYLEKIEQEVVNLETTLITSIKKDCIKDIISLRKRLMVLKQFYEQLLNVLDELQENENNTLPERTLHRLAIFAQRVDRLYHNVLNLRDYVTQVRESYQAEVDISLNNTMKVFTVIAAIFLPLTLLVGWYGMNFPMPEFNWRYGYLMVVIIAAAVVIFCLAYFKRHKWF